MDQANIITVNEEPRRGHHPLDRTAVYSPQMTWALRNRQFWPPVLRLWQRPTPWNNPTYEIGVMRYKGHVVLDTTSKPVRGFRIPLTISSEVEGLRTEAWMRSDSRLSLKDIEARLWTKDKRKINKDKPNETKEPAFNNRTFAKRSNLARVIAGLISWVQRKDRDEQNAFMDRLRTPQQRADNRTVDQDLTLAQQLAYAKLGERGPTKSKAGRGRKSKKDVASDSDSQSSSSRAATAEPEVLARSEGEDAIDLDPDYERAVAESLNPRQESEPADAAGSEDGDDAMDLDPEYEQAIAESLILQQASDDDGDDLDPEYDQAIAESLIQQQASADDSSPSSSIADPLDSRHHAPTNPVERANLQLALQMTVDDYVNVTGQRPLPTDQGDNYFSQWGMLQGQLMAWWESRGYNTDDTPRLLARGRWTGGIAEFGWAETE